MTVEDTLVESPETWLLFNAAGDLIQIQKYGEKKEVFTREIQDATVSDRTVDNTKTIKYSGWIKSWEPGV